MQNMPVSLQYYKFCAYGFLKNLRFFDIFFLLFLRESGISYLQIGTLYSIRQVTINIFEIPSGIVADAFGRKSALMFSMFSYIISFAVFYFAHDFGLYAFAMIAFGIGEAFRTGTHKAMILDYLKQNNLLQFKTRYYGSTRSWSQIGSALSSLSAMVIVFLTGNYREVFLITTIPYLLDLILISTYPSSLNKRPKEDNSRSILPSLGREISAIWRSFLEIFKSVNSMRAIFSASAYIALFKSTKDYIQPVLETMALTLPLLVAFESQKRSAIVIGFTYFLIFLMTSYAARNAWKLEARLKNLPLSIDAAYLVGVTGIGVSGVLLKLEYSIPAVIAFISLYLIQNIRRPLAVSYLSELISQDVMASGLSVESQMETLLVAIFAPVLGLVIDLTGIGGGLMFAGFSFLLMYPFLRLSRGAESH